METLSLHRPDDWHLHVRDAEVLSKVVPHSAQRFGRALIMPNLKPPVTTVTQALQYRDRICACVPEGAAFEPLMSLYLTDCTTVEEVRRVAATPQICAFKLYPAGATTNSDDGVTEISALYPVFNAMAEHGVVLCVHGEVTDPVIDVFDRERIFIDQVLQPLQREFPTLKIVFEHITTAEAVEFVLASGSQVAATITAHHLLLNRNAIFSGGIRPHYYCLPVLKREHHRQALLRAVASGSPQFFAGTDSAPHARGRKETGCGCAGCYTAHAAVELYAEAFESVGALAQLDGFMSLYGAQFYGLAQNSSYIVLQKSAWQVPSQYPYVMSEALVPLRADEWVHWQLIDKT